MRDKNDKGLMILKEIQIIFHHELDVLYGKDEVDSFFYILTEEFLNMRRLELSLQPNFNITEEEELLFKDALSKLKLEQPIQYILGKSEFFGFPFLVNRHTLIPRPETEELVAWICSQYFKSQSALTILDIGTGSGCIAISLAKSIPNAHVYAMDISLEALKIAQTNARVNDVQIDFIKADILNQKNWKLDFKDLKFDIIVSNPPYVRNMEKSAMSTNVLGHEPSLALFVDDSKPLIFYDAIVQFAIKRLTNEGQLFFEINQYLGNEMIELLEDAGLKNILLKKDIFGNDRMIRGVKDSK